ncbi:MAG: Stk1 family PASTA domain-containing Ser/Thr kinase, partial [Oscillospiraceae bacterium]|nr:Stk1 family PASTA domain-containing Ser/Thr kinase [Oscillospiraceae bacterium]
MIGKMLDNRYRIENLVGSGGMANVYKATDTEENKTVAVKLLREEFLDKPEFLKRFRAEAQAVISLAHPNIVKIHNVNFRGNEQYIVMEYINGVTLKEYIDSNKKLDRREAVHFTLQILRALSHAHSKGVIHCDIKPHNIMLLEDGTVKMMDFGIARIARDKIAGDGENTIGSVHYLSPEQALGEELEPSSDVYSVGIMLYEMLTGQKPFDGKDINEIAQKHLYNVPVPPSKLNPTIPLGLQEIILKALEKNIKEHTRYEDALEMLKDLEAFKYNNDITFGYVFNTEKEKVKVLTEETRYFKNETFPEKQEEPQEEYYEEDDDDYEDEEEPEGKSLFIPILSAVTIVVIIAAVFFVVSLVNDAFGSGNGENSGSKKSTPFELQSFVGMTIEEAGTYCQEMGLELVISPEPVPSEYQANIICEQAPPSGTKVKKEQVITVTISSGQAIQVEIPDILGQDFKSAQKVLESEEYGLVCSMEFVNSEQYSLYQICGIDPPAGTMVEKGTVVNLQVSTGGESVAEVEVPDFNGMNVADAKIAAQHAGLVLKVSDEAENSPLPKDAVIRQNPVKGSLVIKGVEVIVTLSTGVAPTNEVSFDIALPVEYTGAYLLELGTETPTSKTFTVDSLANVS